jgi:hypothetical protein
MLSIRRPRNDVVAAFVLSSATLAAQDRDPVNNPSSTPRQRATAAQR